MERLLLIIHVFVTIFLIGIILIQKTSSSGFGQNSNSGMMMNVRGRKNFFTRATAILATIFLANSLFMAILTRKSSKDFVEKLEQTKKVETLKDQKEIISEQKDESDKK